MKSIALYSSFSKLNIIEDYIKQYLLDLNNYVEKIIFLTNERFIDDDDVNFLKSNNIKLIYVKNEGMDFGMWYKIIGKLHVENLNFLCLCNDSCVSVKSLNEFFAWALSSKYDYCGITDSSEWGYHIQSYFLLCKSSILKDVKKYFSETGLIKTKKENIIRKYEIGLSQFLFNNGFNIGAFISHKQFTSNKNVTTFYSNKLLQVGCPLIKKNIEL